MKLTPHRKSSKDFLQDGSVMYGLFVKQSANDTYTGAIGWNSDGSFPETLICPNLKDVRSYDNNLLSAEVIRVTEDRIVSLHKTFDSLFSNFIHDFIKDPLSPDLSLIVVMFNRETSKPIEYLCLTSSIQCQEFYNEVCTFPL